MSWNTINSSEYTSGEPVSVEIQGKVVENLESLNDRITSLEGQGTTVYPPLIFQVKGSYGESGDLTVPATNVLKTTLNFNLTVTGVRLLIDQAGISGTTEVDLLYKRAASSTYYSIFTTKPSVGYASGNDSISSNAVLDATKVNLQAGDTLRLDITDAQKRANTLIVRIDYSKT
jgi:hypothetical protein